MNRPLTSSEIRAHRSGLLRFAGHFSTDKSPETVTAHAAVLQTWLDAAATPDDCRARYEALSHGDTNRSYKRRPDDDPEALIAEATTYYEFLKAA